MNRPIPFVGLFIGLLLGLTLAPQMPGQNLLADIRAEHDPAKRAELALTYADNAFDNAREYYSKGEIEKGDAQLEDMTNALNECVLSADAAHRVKFYKKAEQNVAMLQRRFKTVLDDLEVQKRGWAEYTDRKLDEIHDKLLAGVMRR